MYIFFLNTENCMVIARGQRERGWEVGEGGPSGARWGQRETLLGAVGTQFSVQMLFC